MTDHCPEVVLEARAQRPLPIEHTQAMIDQFLITLALCFLFRIYKNRSVSCQVKCGFRLEKDQ